MRKLILLFLTIVLTATPAWATWTFKQAKCTGSSTTEGCTTGTTCTISGLTAITAGSTLVGVSLDDNGLQGISSINGETWTHCTNCLKNNAGLLEVDASYVLSAVGGETSFIFTMSGTIAGMNVCIYEAKSSLTAAFDTANNSLISSAAPTTVALTLTGSNDFLVAGICWTGSVTGVNSPYANMIESNGNGSASNINTSSGNGAAFTPTTSASGPDFTIAFSESGGGGGGGTVIGGKTTIGGSATVGP
jgi:hypothetical protein